MTHDTETGWRKTIIGLLREAFVTARTCRERGTWPAGFRSNMPAYIHEYFEAYGLERAQVGTLPPSAQALDRLDAVCAAMAHRTLNDYERELLWLRAGKVHWKDIVKRRYIPERTLRRHYSDALTAFAIRYVAMERERAARIV